MTQRVYRMEEGGLQYRFNELRKKIQIYGGGFANGKTAASIVLKILPIAKDYPGANILVARSTYPKLNDTIRKEFIKWCPPSWIKSFPKGQNSSNTCTLKNGTEINFRYVSQQGKNEESTTSNLLSATYDLIVIDQIEDPEINHKDFLDLMGRLRGSTPYTGDDPSMPKSGPRWFIVTCNPTRNWFFSKVVKPLQEYERSGRVTEDLIIDKRGELLIDLVEGATYENRANLGEDYIELLEASYRGQMRDRFLLGKWAAYEGLVFWMFDDDVHTVSKRAAEQYYWDMLSAGFVPEILEGYDHGMIVPSCYLFGYVDFMGNTILLDGFYKKEFPIGDATKEIKRIREKYVVSNIVDATRPIYADPSLMRRGAASKKVVGQTVADIFWDNGRGVRLVRGNADINNGIIKMQGYLLSQKNHQHPLSGHFQSPYLYVADELDFVVDEFNNYYWQTNTSGDKVDKPQDKNDHAMNAIKYMLSKRPNVAKLVPKMPVPVPNWLQWQERDLEAAKYNPQRH